MGIIAIDGGIQIATATEYLKSRYYHHSVNEPLIFNAQNTSLF